MTEFERIRAGIEDVPRLSLSGPLSQAFASQARQSAGTYNSAGRFEPPTVAGGGAYTSRRLPDETVVNAERDPYGEFPWEAHQQLQARPGRLDDPFTSMGVANPSWVANPDTDYLSEAIDKEIDKLLKGK